MVSYVVVTILAALVGIVELIARYPDAPTDVVRRLPGCIYVALNATAGAVALLVIDEFGWTFGSAPDGATRIVQVAVAGLSAMAVLRSALFTVRVGKMDVAVGPNLLLAVVLAAADRAVDRNRANRRNAVVVQIMDSVDFDKAKKALPSYCLTLMQNVSREEQRAVSKEVKSLANSPDLNGTVKTLNLGLVLLNVVGEDVLRASVEALGGEIEPDGTST